ncbi:juvenile hormone esterase-like isoform X2 [Schistocerca piceifrons]|uniref:juvenile hormone esterase-like isoform X2 n=1 Tax=Schistocerca piceifrons TaxID=274613 RepID=UPI001F5E6141|nr:juvenile hormone esterase-like isoform X2 [Schistocerca piceifrons]
MPRHPQRQPLLLLLLLLLALLAAGSARAGSLGWERYMGWRARDAPLNDTDLDGVAEYFLGQEEFAKIPPPVVRTPLGSLRGSVIASRTGKPIYSFRGVRYAQPPVGNLRFKPPVPIGPWEGTVNATADGFACPQEENYIIPTDEDCLFLNVYTTKLPMQDANPKRAVMVWVHAGGWYGGTGNSALHGPQYLMDQDIVLVTFNYRLGALGLFHKAIAMSSSINAQADMSVSGDMDLAKRQAAALNCPSETSKQIYECLMKLPAQTIASSLNKLGDWAIDPVLIFYPVIEPDLHDKSERFLHWRIDELMLSGHFSHVPFLTGYTKDEFSWRALSIINNTSWRTEMQENFTSVAPLAFMYKKEHNSAYKSQNIRNFYLHNLPISEFVLEGLGNIYSDSIINFGVDRAARIIASTSTEPVYFYRFSYPGRYSFVYYPGTSVPYGVMHQDDTMYLFHVSVLFPFFNEGAPEIPILERHTKMWANFVIHGNPTPHKDIDKFETKWEPFEVSDTKYMDIGARLELKTALNQKRMLLWDKLFPLPPNFQHRPHPDEHSYNFYI